MLDPYFTGALHDGQQAWRSVVAVAAAHGVPCPAFMSALAYYDGYRSERLPANLLQAQRDYFGAHTYERVDEPRVDLRKLSSCREGETLRPALLALAVRRRLVHRGAQQVGDVQGEVGGSGRG